MQIMLPNYITGKYAVGTELFTVTDESRLELLGNGTGNRRIAVRVYYPADPQAAGTERAPVFSEKKLAAVRKTYHVRKMPPELLTADYHLDAPHAAGRFPVVLFSHGYNGYVEGNTLLCCCLASEGYIVVSVGHAYEACENDYSDGSDLYDRTINKRMYDSVFGALRDQRRLLRSKGTPQKLCKAFDEFQRKHCSFIMARVPEWGQDMLCALRTLKLTYADYADISRVAAAGQSLGGAASYWLCRNSEEIKCGVNIDGGVFGEYSGSSMKKPFLQISCEENRNVATRPLLNTEAPVECEIFPAMKHIGFMDAKFFGLPGSIVGAMDGAEMFSRLSGCVREFLGKYL